MNNGKTIRTIEECCDILDNLRKPINDEIRQTMRGNIPYYGANGIQGYIDRFIFDEDLILMAEDGGNFEQFDTRPIAYKISGKSWVNNHAHILKAKSGYCQDYLFYSLVNKDIIKYIKGGTRSKLNKSDLVKIEVEIPNSISKQKEVAHILTTCDTVIEQTQAAIAKYKAIKQGLLHDLFTRGLTANGHLRPTYHDAPDLYKESELGMIPREWEVKRLVEIALVNPSTNIPSTFNTMTQVTFLKMEDVSNSGFIISNKSLPIRYLQKKGFTQFQENDILFAKITPCMENGKGALAKNLFNGVGFGSTEFHVFRPLNEESISYVYFLSVSSKFRLQAESQMTGSAGQQRVSTKYLENYKIATPQLDEQLEIGVRLNKITNKIRTEETLLQKYQSIKQGLMGDLLGCPAPGDNSRRDAMHGVSNHAPNESCYSDAMHRVSTIHAPNESCCSDAMHGVSTIHEPNESCCSDAMHRVSTIHEPNESCCSTNASNCSTDAPNCSSNAPDCSHPMISPNE